MRKIWIALASALTLTTPAFVVPAPAAPVKPASLRSFFPATGLPKFIADQWDLGSFDSALNPDVRPDRRNFASVGLMPVASTDTSVTLESGKLRIIIETYAREDVNHDGLEDVSVCYREQIKGAPGDKRRGTFLLARYSADTPLIALNMPAHYNSACEQPR